jgi:tripartite-type tricarboxylate transporter receptor subunit TctC
MRDTRRILVCIYFSLCVFLAPAPGQTAEFPTKPISLIIPYPAGGATDVVIRPLAAAAKESLKQPVVIENKPGGGTAVGIGSIIGKRPDGYQLSIAATTIHRTSFISKISFDTVNDLTPILRVGGYCFGILVRPDSPFKTLKDLVDYAKANPDKLTYMSGGIGTGGHIAMEELAFKAGFKINHVPSKGDPEASTGLLGGHVDAASASSGWIPLVEAGRLKLLATYGGKRTKRFPDVPTVSEFGYRVVEELPMGIFGPKGMPKDLVATLDLAFKKALSDPIFVSTMDKFEMPILYQDPEGFTKFWAEAYKEAGEHIKKYIK